MFSVVRWALHAPSKHQTLSRLWNIPNTSSRVSCLFSTTSSEESSSVRLSKLLSQFASNLSISRRQAEGLIQSGEVTVAGKTVTAPHILVDWNDLKGGNVLVKVGGKAVLLADLEKKRAPKVWAVHKFASEVVTENDPHGRPSMIERLVRGGVGKIGKDRVHLKPIGRLDMSTEGLILVTNDGDFKRQMELPSSQIHRVYRTRVHGKLTAYKLDRIRNGGVRFENTRYGPMKVSVERSRGARSSTNTWLRITSTEGKNRQIRNVFSALGGKSWGPCRLGQCPSPCYIIVCTCTHPLSSFFLQSLSPD
jgi:23S rRNA pseudouridine2605 synthase